jgi:hypothetical protein
MSCIISSNCNFIDVKDNLYSYYTLSNNGDVGGNLYNSGDQIVSLNAGSNYRVKQAFLIHKNDNSILNDIELDNYESLMNNINLFDITKYTTDAINFQSAISDFSNENNNKVKDHKTYYVFVYDGTVYQTYGGSALSQSISELVPNGVKFCGLIEYLYDCKGPVSPPVLSDDQGCYLNMDITKIIKALPTKFSDLKNVPISDESKFTFSMLFNNFDDQNKTYNQAKLTFTSIVVYFEEIPNCLLNSTSAISIDKFTDYVNDSKTNLDDPLVRACVVNTIKTTFGRVQNYVEKMLLYKKLNTAPDGVFLSDKKTIEKRLGEDNLTKFYNIDGKYNMFLKIAHIVVIIAVILMFLFKANKSAVKNYIILTLCIFMPYLLQAVQFTISHINEFREKIIL